MKFNILLLVVFSINASGQRYDFSDGDISSIRTCDGFKNWFTASVDDYPPPPTGSIEGFVLRSPIAFSNCILLVQNINIYKHSIFRIEMYAEKIKDILTIYALDGRGQIIRDWFFIDEKQGWVEAVSRTPTFAVSDTQKYNLEIVTTAVPSSSFISIRYFEIINGSDDTTITNSPSTTNEMTTLDHLSSTTAESTTDDLIPTTELTTDDLISTTELTTDNLISSSDAPSTESDTNEPTDTTKYSSDETTLSTNKPGETLPTTTTYPSPTKNPSFEVDGWSIVIGIAIGAILTTLLYAVSAVASWIYCLQRSSLQKTPITNQSNSLPRLQVISKPGSGPGITAQVSQSNLIAERMST